MSKQQNIHPTALQEPDTEGYNSVAYINQLRKEVENKAVETINWYIKRKQYQSVMSKMLRLFAILLVLIGGLHPILLSLDLGLPKNAQYGYIAFAIAAACLSLDKFMGFSSSWIRYIKTAFDLQKALAEFQTDWVLMWAEVKNDSLDSKQQKKLLCRIKVFQTEIYTEIEHEFKMWASEFQNSLVQLQKDTQAKREISRSRPGIMELTVTNAKHAQHGLNVKVDDLTVAHMTGELLQIGHILPGQHYVVVHGTVDGKDVQASGRVDIVADETAELKLSLPIE
ncbi:MAG: hypothetical protein DRR19_28575 [Candidatus Parabeggiatoa sp. nov. 1]|nr:MAG: hypothetical protein DRR19_28575 [Gammaproteobacteria bacterium]